jgi:integrase/recombinase XerD
VSTPSKVPVRFIGPLATVLHGLVAEKQGAGYRYEATARDLLRLDRFCVAVWHDDTSLPRELVLYWTAKQAHETEATRQHRISLIRIVGEYMQRCGYPAYVYPRHADRQTPSRYTPLAGRWAWP